MGQACVGVFIGRMILHEQCVVGEYFGWAEKEADGIVDSPLVQKMVSSLPSGLGSLQATAEARAHCDVTVERMPA